MGDVIPLRAPSGLCADTADVARQLRALADDIDEGCWGETVQTVTCVIEYDNGCEGRWVLSTKPIDKARSVGLLMFAVNQLMNPKD